MIVTRERKKIILSTKGLETRLDINAQTSNVDFHRWLNSHLAVKKGMDVLDVGCGTGAQAVRFLRRVGLTGSVSALDLSSSSIERLGSALAHARNFQAVTSDMAKTSDVINNEFRVKEYELAQSTYSLYYANNPTKVLDAMRRSLKTGGRLAICTPNDPHTLSRFCGRFAPLSDDVVKCGRFGQDVLEPYFRKYFQLVDIHLLRNELTFESTDQVLELIKRAAYFSPETETKVRREIDRKIASDGVFSAQKNSFLIIGHNIIRNGK